MAFPPSFSSSCPHVSLCVQIKSLALRGNLIKSLPAEFGANLCNLQVLDAGDNRLTSLDALCGLQQLRRLHVKNNVIERLPEGISSLTSLESLNISCNKLESLGMVRGVVFHTFFFF